MINFLKSLSGHVVGFIFVFLFISVMSSMFNALISPISAGIVGIALTQVFFYVVSRMHYGYKWKTVFALLNVLTASTLGFYGSLAESYSDLLPEKIFFLLVIYILLNYDIFLISKLK